MRGPFRVCKMSTPSKKSSHWPGLTGKGGSCLVTTWRGKSLRLDIGTLAAVPLAQLQPGTFFKPIVRAGNPAPTYVVASGGRLIAENFAFALAGAARFTAHLFRNLRDLNTVVLPYDAASLRIQLHEPLQFEGRGNPGSLLLDHAGPAMWARWQYPQGLPEEGVINLRTWTFETDLMRAGNAAHVQGWSLWHTGADGDVEVFSAAQPPAAQG